MKKYLKITFIFIMIFSMFVKSGIASDKLSTEEKTYTIIIPDLVREEGRQQKQTDKKTILMRENLQKYIKKKNTH